MLDSLGYVSIAAQSGSEAPGLIANGLELDIVIADLGRPHDAVPLIRSILITGYGDHDVLNEFDEARILPKPYAGEDLVNRIVAAPNRHKRLPEE
jgi:hypothetical protein